VSGAEALDARPGTGADTGAGASDALHGSASPSSSSSSLNPLVAQREESRSAVSGSGVVEDIWGIAHGLSEGSWLETGLSSVSLVADAVGVGVDPLGTLIAWGAGWLIDHFGPLKSWMDEFLGDADSVRADAATWSNVAQAMGECADSLEQDERGLMGEQVGATATAYRASNADTISALRTASGAADAMGKATSVLAEVVGLVHDLLRDAISAIVGTLASAIIEAIATFGLAIPLIIAQVQVKVGAKATEMAAHVTGVLKSARALAHNLTHLSGLLDMLRGMLTRAKGTAGSLKSTIADAASHAGGVFAAAALAPRFKRPQGTALERLCHRGAHQKRWTPERALEKLKRQDKIRATKRKTKRNVAKWLKKRGLSKSSISRAEIRDTLKSEKVMELPRADRKKISVLAERYRRAHNAQVRAAETMGTVAAELKQHEAGRYLLSGIGGTGTGTGAFDLLAVDEDLKHLHFVEAKGGEGSLGEAHPRLPDGTTRTLEQGSAEYLNYIATKDSAFLERMAENPEFWRQIKEGKVILHNDVCLAPLPDLDAIEYTSERFIFTPETIRDIDKAINEIQQRWGGIL